MSVVVVAKIVGNVLLSFAVWYLNSIETKYLCQVFYRKLGTDKWKIIFAFFPKEHLDVSLMWYKYDKI